MITIVRACLAALALTVMACSPPDGPVAIQTQAQQAGACNLSAIRGQLVADPRWGLALRSNVPEGATTQPETLGVVWPYGYSASREHGIVVLLDPSGSPVAQEGDEVVTGPIPAGNVVYPCGSIEVIQRAADGSTALP